MQRTCPYGAQALLGPNKEEGPTADPFLKNRISTFLARLSMSPATFWLHDTTTLCIMELIKAHALYFRFAL